MKIDLTKKEKAIKLRKTGKSYRDIEKVLSIPRSTLSGWFRNIKLSESQHYKLHQRWLSALVKARVKAAQIHKQQRLDRISKIKQEVEEFTFEIEPNQTLGELIFSTFYLAEGAKKENAVVIANSNPDILKGFFNLFQHLYKINKPKITCRLHLRKDQSEKQMINYWSRKLQIPKKQFRKTQFDKRTIKPTYKEYKGVCVITYCDMNLQRRIMYIGNKLLEKMANL